MRALFRILAFVGLALVIAPPIVYYGAEDSPTLLKHVMLAGTVVWFTCSYLGFRQNPADVELDEAHTPVS